MNIFWSEKASNRVGETWLTCMKQMQTEISAKVGCSDRECRSIEEFTSVSLLRTKTIQKPPFQGGNGAWGTEKKKDIKIKVLKGPNKKIRTPRDRRCFLLFPPRVMLKLPLEIVEGYRRALPKSQKSWKSQFSPFYWLLILSKAHMLFVPSFAPKSWGWEQALEGSILLSKLFRIPSGHLYMVELPRGRNHLRSETKR